MMIARSYCTVKMHGFYTDRESGPLAKEQRCIDTKQRNNDEARHRQRAGLSRHAQ